MKRVTVMTASKLTGTGALLRLNLRHDWLKIVYWWIALIGLMTAAAVKFDGMYGTTKAMNSIITTLKTPAMVSLLGPFTGTKPYTVAMVYGAEMMVFMGLFAAMMNLYFAVHATRMQEDDGTTELLLAHAVGRQSPLVAAIGELVFINLGAGVLEALVLQFAGMSGANAAGNWLFGLGLAAFGFMFGVFALFFSQIVNNGRSATILSYIFLAVLFIARMGTDVQNPKYTWWTIFGWIEKMKLYTGNDWTPVWMMLILSVVMLIVTVLVAVRRDIGAGIVAPRNGRKTASVWLRGPITLLMRLDRVSTAIWLIGLALFGASYGSIFGTVGDLVKTNPTLGQLLGSAAVKSANKTIILGLANKLTIIFVVVASIPPLMTLLKLNTDDKKGYLEAVHAKPVSRLRLFITYTGHALAVGTVSFALAIYGMAFAGQQSMAYMPVSVGQLMRGFVGFWPALLVVCGIAAVLVGALPKVQSVVWILPIYGVFSLYIGALLDLPKWAQRISPYGWVNSVPSHAVNWTTFSWMTVLGIILLMIGYGCYRRRDLTMN